MTSFTPSASFTASASLSLQMKRAINSVGLNAGEGLSARAGNRTVRLESAMARGRECIIGLRIAGAAGYLDAERVAREVDSVDHIVAILDEGAKAIAAVGAPRTTAIGKRRPRSTFAS